MSDKQRLQLQIFNVVSRGVRCLTFENVSITTPIQIQSIDWNTLFRKVINSLYRNVSKFETVRVIRSQSSYIYSSPCQNDSLLIEYPVRYTLSKVVPKFLFCLSVVQLDLCDRFALILGDDSGQLVMESLFRQRCHLFRLDQSGIDIFLLCQTLSLIIRST